MPITWVGGASLEYVQDDAQVRKKHKYDPIRCMQVCASLLSKLPECTLSIISGQWVQYLVQIILFAKMMKWFHCCVICVKRITHKILPTYVALNWKQVKSSRLTCIVVVWHYYFCIAHQLSQIVSSSCLLYCQDLAEHLVIHGHCLTSTDHKELSSLFNLGQESPRWAMDRRVALAMANLNIPQNWNVLGSHSGNGESRIMLSCWTGIPA